MPDYGPYTPPGASSVSANVTESSTPPCLGGADSWTLDANGCINVIAFTPSTAILTDFGVDVNNDFVVTDVTVRIKGSFAGSGTLTAQLYYDGNVIGDAQNLTPGPGAYDNSFTGAINVPNEGWNCSLTPAQLESADFGVKFTWTSVLQDTVFGVSLTATADTNWKTADGYAEPAWRSINEESESAFNTDEEFAEPAFRTVNEQAVGP